MSEEIKKWLNGESFVLAYRFNFDAAYEVNRDLQKYVKQLQKENENLKQINEEHRKLNGELRKENEELQKQLDIKNNGFMASIDETCEYATVLTEFEKWLEAEILKMGLNDFYALGIHNCYDKLQELKKEGKK